MGWGGGGGGGGKDNFVNVHIQSNQFSCVRKSWFRFKYKPGLTLIIETWGWVGKSRASSYNFFYDIRAQGLWAGAIFYEPQWVY